MPSVAVEQPLGLTLSIMRKRAFASAWQDSKRPRGEDEAPPSGPLTEWVQRIQGLRDQDDLARVLGNDPALVEALAAIPN